jgi:hypothetical protein
LHGNKRLGCCCCTEWNVATSMIFFPDGSSTLC